MADVNTEDGTIASPHTIVYGSCPSSLREFAIDLIRPLSPSNMRYERKIIHHADKHNISIVLSDIHYEVDMSCLGRSARAVWHQVHATIMDSIRASPSKRGVIICKSFEGCCPDLARVFFSYLQRPMVVLTNTRFIILTTHCSFIPSSTTLRCRTVAAGPRAPAVEGSACVEAPLCEKILRCIIGEVDIAELRTVLYTVQTYLFSLDRISWCLVHQVVQYRNTHQSPVTCEDLSVIVRHVVECCYSYNMCYRPIFHLEKLALGLAGVVNAR